MTSSNHSDDELIRYHPSASHPGWNEWSLLERDAHRFNTMLQPILTRGEADGTATVRFIPSARHSNVSDFLHGGALLAFLDIAMFAGARTLGILTAAAAVTADIQVQFVASGRIDLPVDATIEIVRNTRSLIFVRGIVRQSDGETTTIASFTGLLKKLAKK